MENNTQLLFRAKENDFDSHYRILEELFDKPLLKIHEKRRTVSWGTVPKNVFHILKKINLPILEVGSGAGFIAKGLIDLNCTVFATDLLKDETYEHYFTNIEKLEMSDAIKKYGENSNYIFLSVWPRKYICEQLWKSNNLELPEYIVWCGEPPDGCTGIISDNLLDKYNLVGAFRGTLNDQIWLKEITVILKRGGKTSWNEIYQSVGPKKHVPFDLNKIIRENA